MATQSSSELADRLRQLRVFLVGSAIALGALVTGQIIFTLSAFLLQSVGIPISENQALQIGVATVLMQGVAFGGFAIGYVALSEKGFTFLRVHKPTLQEGAVVIGGSILVFALLLVISLTLSYFGIPVAENQITEIASQSPMVFLVLVPLSYLLVGPGEELLYRGVVQGLFSEEYNSILAIVLASGLFAVMHVFSLTGDGKLTYLLIVFLLATILGATYHYTDNLAVPAFIHATYNAVQFGTAYLAATGL